MTRPARLLLPLLALAAPLRGQGVPPGLQPGRVIERLVSPTDTGESYAVYLPSAYRTDTRWPVLFLMDPRGRALIPMELARTAAERHGFIVLSSYNTLSDGPAEPNVRAMNAVLADLPKLFAADPRRLYLVGFSGTARMAWEFGFELRGTVAGLIGFGAGLPSKDALPARKPLDPTPFVYYGGAGTSDFNYDEMRVLEVRLDHYGMPHHFEYWDGPHGWPPQPVMTRAIDWMVLQAMKRGVVPRDTAEIDTAFSAALASARDLEGSGHAYEAWRAYRALVEDFTGLRNVEPEARKAEELGKSKAVRHTEDEVAKVEQRFWDYLRRLNRFLVEFRRRDPPEPLAQTLDALDVGRLRREAADTADPIAAGAAQRLLESVYVSASFYEPRDFLAQGRPRQALAMLDLAQALKPDRPNVCYQRARALAALGRGADAVDALRCLVRGAPITADGLAADSNLVAIRGNPAFTALLDSLRARATP
jgi:predicted esterase